jgi:hypothetical protein
VSIVKFVNPLAKKVVIGQSFLTYCFLFMVILLAKMKNMKKNKNKMEKVEMEGK